MAAFLCLLFVPWSVAASEPINYQEDVRQILSDKCFKCHGPDGQARQADLRLDDREAALHVLSPDAPEESELLVRILSDDPDYKMPPPESKMELTAAEIETLQQWIAEQAPYQRHWSFQSLRPVEVPKVEDAKFDSPIDAFVQARLKSDNMTIAPEASRERLVRRLSFDLTGLPPTLEEMNRFLADEEQGAYERLVDYFLDKQEYGERMASDWLDVARYSDTYGYQVDRDRYVWPWRDWVIQAFNDNLPYDDFITQQLAGDLLPNASDQNLLATTFNRLHPQKVEGGSVPEEFRVEYVADRNHTFGTAFLGLTLECARCHDHKYDPISQREYYQFFAFFNTIDEAGLYSYFTSSIPTPTLLLSDDAKRQAIATAKQEVEEAEQAVRQIRQEREEAFQDWWASQPQAGEIQGQVEHRSFDDKQGGANQSVEGRFGNAVQLSGDDGIGLSVGNFPRFHPFTVSLWLKTPDVKERAVVFHRSRAWTDAASRGYQLLLEDGKLSVSLIHFWPGNAIRVRAKEAVVPEEWTHVVMTYDGSSRADGLKIFVDGSLAPSDVVRDNLYKNITGGGGDNITIGQRFRDRGFTGGSVDEFRVFNRELTPIEVRQLFDPEAVQGLIASPSDDLDDEQQGWVLDYYLTTADETYQNSLKTLQAAREKHCKLVDGVQEIMVMREMATPRETFRLERGAYDSPAESVEAGTPEALLPFPEDQPRNRLGLARWLTDPRHPLTSRVAVNRVWQQLFGQGLVRTPEDFGSQGASPTHQDLLDWLSYEFIDSGWDLKQLIKQIVMSATYRQSSVVSDEIRSHDPQNLLLARAPSYRWPAEMIRDNALAVSGLLDRKLGGAPVRPYEVAVSFKPMKRDEGAGLYRRSLYTFWKRTAPAPMMMTLDAAKREVCVVKRERTASPLQALVLLNSPQFVEAARVLAQRLLVEYGDQPQVIVDRAFRELTSREITDHERRVLLDLWTQQREYFQSKPDLAGKFLETGDAPIDDALDRPLLAACATVMSTILNYDECVVRR